MASSSGKGDGCDLPATAARWLTDEPQPGLVLVELADAYGRPHQLVGKSTYFGGNLLPSTPYPCPTTIPCTIDDVDADIATVSTRWLTGGPDDTPFVFAVRTAVLGPVSADVTAIDEATA